MDISLDLRGLRKGRGMTQSQLGLVCGMSKSQISRMESGELGSQETLSRYLDALGYDMRIIAESRYGGSFLDRSRVIDVLRAYKQNNASRYGIVNLGLFGSYSRGEQTPESDIDVCVKLSAPSLFKLAAMQDDLRRIFKIDVDVVSLGSKMKKEFIRELSSDVIYV